MSIYLLSTKRTPNELLALEIIDVLQEALHHLFAVHLVSDKLSYYTFTKADELTSEQVDLFWVSHDEGQAIAAAPAE